MIGAKHLVLLAVGLYASASVALPVYHEDFDYDGHHGHHGHHALPPATSYATISTTHVKVQHPPAAPPKYSTAVAAPYKYEYAPREPQTAYKYITLSEALALQQQQAGAVKYEEPSTTGYKYLAASPTYKYVQPTVVTTEPEAAEEPTNSLKYALKYERNSYKLQQQQQQRQPDEQQPEYEQQPAVRYKYVTVPAYKYVQQAPADEYGRHQLSAAGYEYAAAAAATADDDKTQYD